MPDAKQVCIAAGIRKAPNENTFAVGLGKRIANLVFGNPSIKRAYGMYGRRWTKKSSGPSQETPKRNAYVRKGIFRLEPQNASTDMLPRIWLTEAAGIAGCSADADREISAVYPNGPDKGGWKALGLAEAMLGEGFNADGECPNDIRKGFFQAAEILLLHSVSHRNIKAYAKLADIYRHDLCKGDYWKSSYERQAKHARKLDSYSLLRRAWMLYSLAAKEGNAGAYIELGDVILSGGSGIGECRRAYGYFCRAAGMALSDALKSDSAAHADNEENEGIADDEILLSFGTEALELMGRAMLRIGECAEQGIGCKRNVAKANDMFALSKKMLDIAFECGCWHIKMETIRAFRGLKRTEFELEMERAELEIRA